MDTINKNVKAIETVYNGYRFRSRLEARWAVFFDALDVKYEYEKEGYELPSGRYLPDYWLPELDIWVEIKGAPPTEKEEKKCRELFDHHGSPVVCFWEQPSRSLGKIYCEHCTDSGGGWYENNVIPIVIDGGMDILCLCEERKGRRSLLKSWAGDYKLVSSRIVHCFEMTMAMVNRGGKLIKEKVVTYPLYSDIDNRLLHYAFDAAKSARFEHGERGA